MLEVWKNINEGLEKKSLKENELHCYIKQGVQHEEHLSESPLRKFVTGVVSKNCGGILEPKW